MDSCAEYTVIQRATERLRGILAGIALDCRINNLEIAGLYDWMQIHEYLHHLEPFKSVFGILNRCLEDSVIDDDEREEILEWCSELSHKIPVCVTTATRRLHGVLNGVAIDNKLIDTEIIALRDWLYDYSQFKEHWPFYEIWEIIENILDDGVVTPEEENILLNYFKNFMEEKVAPDLHDIEYYRPWMSTQAPVLQPFTALCDRQCEIVFKENLFCFTGPARIGPRKLLHQMAVDRGGVCSKNVVKELNYLVIGAQSSPCWAYSTYGRKVETVIKYREEGEEITILHEDDFVKQASL